jgi:autotransporter translocation and assembly factor TamB
MPRWLRASARVLAWIALWSALVLLIAAIALIGWARSSSGRRRLLAAVVALAERRLDGTLAIGRLEGDLTREIVLRDVRVFDGEGELAASAGALRVRYELLPLIRRRVRISWLRVEDARVHARVNRAGVLNLTTLARSSDQTTRAFSIRVERVLGHAALEYHAVEPAQRWRGELDADASVSVEANAIDVRLFAVTLTAAAPWPGSAVARGGFHVDAGALAADMLEVDARLDAGLHDGLVPGATLRGPVEAELRASGTTRAGLSVSLRARPPGGELRVDAQATRTPPMPLAWSCTVSARALDPAALVVGAPPGRVELDARGDGAGRGGRVVLERLAFDARETRVRARGVVSLAPRLALDATVEARSSDLSRLGVRGLAGRVAANAHVVRDGSRLDLDARVAARGLKVAAARFARLDGAVHVAGLDGTADVRARGFELPRRRLTLDRVALAVASDRGGVAVHADAAGPYDTIATLRAHGPPLVSRVARAQPSLALVVDELLVGPPDQRWRSTRPGQLRFDGDGFTASLALAERDAQQLSVAASWARRSDALAVELSARALDVRPIVGLLAPSLHAPASRLDLDARVSGTTRHPLVTARVGGRVMAWRERGVPELVVAANGRIADHRVKLALDGAASAACVRVRLDAPLSLDGDRPLGADVSATGIDLAWLDRWHALPGALAGLGGGVTVTAHARGTSRHPTLHARLDAPDWSLDALEHARAQVDVDYGGARLETRLSAELGASGRIAATASVPIDLPAAARSRHFLDALPRAAPIAATVRVASLDLGRAPLARAGVRTPLAGRVSASVDVSGTLRDPIADAYVDARDLAIASLRGVDLQARAGYQARRAHAELGAALHGAPVLVADAGVDVDVKTILAGRAWMDSPIRLDASVPSYDLDRSGVKDLSGAIAGRAHVRGTIADPDGEATLHGLALRLAGTSFARVDARLDFGGALEASVDAAQTGGRALHLSARLARAADAPLYARLRASRLALALHHVGALHELDGTLDADLTVSGTRAHPQLSGTLELARGALAIAGDPRHYRDVIVDVAARPGIVKLEQLHARAEDGSLAAHGAVALDGLHPQRIDLYARARRFPFEKNNLSAWVDANVELHGERQHGVMVGELSLTQGKAELPRLTGTRRLQSLGPLEDVMFTDAAAQRAGVEEQALRSLSAHVLARVPGPFRIRSPELQVDLDGELELRLAHGSVELFGQIASDRGHVEVLGRRYRVERARVSFEGTPDPRLDVRLSRDLTGATIAIEIHGTASEPQLELTSDPPVYDTAQILGIVVSGDASHRQIDGRATQQQLVGALSSMILSKLEEQIVPRLPIDVIKVERGDGRGAFSSQGLTRIEVGKHLTSRLYVSYLHQFGTPTGIERVNSNEARVDYRFGGRFQLSTRFGDEGIGSVNFYWVVRF